MKNYILKTNDDGSTVTVRDVQLVLLDILKDIDALCRTYEIPYWLTGGSCLGAVRHKGFIPWDDDADIGMMREDYERFLHVCHELGDGYCCQSIETHREYNVVIPAMKIRKKGTYVEENNSLLKNRCKDSDGLFIDVFVVDYVSEDKVSDFGWRMKNGLLLPVLVALDNLHIPSYALKKKYVKNAVAYGKRNRKSRLIGYDLTWCFDSFFHPVVYPKKSVFPLQYVPFEDTYLPIPHDPDPLLRAEVAENYMSFPPEKDQVPKHIKDIKL
ncbi:MAG: LicD family protein [Erysipelotrichaceae bacterium]|nr:LicD family protein [Erysipelotrichaceae bacterium]